MKVGMYPHADGPCTDTSGAPTCSEIPKTFAWDRKVPVAVVYRMEAVLEYCLERGYVPEREDIHNLLLLSLNELSDG